MVNSNRNRNESRFLTLLRELLLPEIVGLLVAWVLAILTNNVILKGITVFLQFILVIFLPIVVWHLLRRMQAHLHYIFKTLICVLITFATAALFSTLTYAQPLEIPQEAQIINGTFYTGKYLRGSSNCRQKLSQCLNKIEIEGEQIYRVPKTRQNDELHIILDINWSKWEKFPTLPRNYKGRVYYTIPFKCDSFDGNSRIAEIYEPNRIKYSITPKSIVLSYFIGFVEIPFLFSGDYTLSRNIIKITREQRVICS